MGLKEAWKALINKPPLNTQSNPLPNIYNGVVVKQGFPVYDYYNQQLNVLRYATLDDIYSIVRLIMKTAAMIPLEPYRITNKNAKAEYDYLMKAGDYSVKGMVKLRKVKSAAMDELPEDDPLSLLLDNPNPLYSKTEFLEGCYNYRLITGNTYIYTPKFEFGPNAGKPIEMWLMPTQFTNPVITQTFPKQITKYQLRLFGIVDIPIEEILHLRYFNPQFNVLGNELIGLSPLQALSRVAQRSQSENDFQVAGFQNGGASGIISFEGIEDTNGATFGKLKQDFYKEGSGTLNARKVLFMGQPATFTQVGLSPVDMDVIESQKITFKRICNAYGVSDVLFNNGEASTESNVKEMVKRLYTNAALPEVYALRDALNKFIVPSFGDDICIEAKITDINELQDDLLATMQAFAASPVMCPNDILEAQGKPRSDDPEMEKIYIKQGYQAIDEMSTITDLPLTSDYGNTGNGGKPNPQQGRANA